MMRVTDERVAELHAAASGVVGADVWSTSRVSILPAVEFLALLDEVREYRRYIEGVDPAVVEAAYGPSVEISTKGEMP